VPVEGDDPFGACRDLWRARGRHFLSDRSARPQDRRGGAAQDDRAAAAGSRGGGGAFGSWIKGGKGGAGNWGWWAVLSREGPGRFVGLVPRSSERRRGLRRDAGRHTRRMVLGGRGRSGGVRAVQGRHRLFRRRQTVYAQPARQRP